MLSMHLICKSPTMSMSLPLLVGVVTLFSLLATGHSSLNKAKLFLFFKPLFFFFNLPQSHSSPFSANHLHSFLNIFYLLLLLACLPLPPTLDKISCLILVYHSLSLLVKQQCSSKLTEQAMLQTITLHPNSHITLSHRTGSTTSLNH